MSAGNFRRARAAITDKEGDGKRRMATAGEVDCPICEKGRLTYRIHTNGHIAARCTTEGCMAWME